MKKNTVNKIVSLVVVLALVVSTLAGLYLGIYGRNTQMVTIRENDQDVEKALYRQVAFIPNTANQNWQEAVALSSALGGGISYEMIAEQGDMTDKEFTKAVKSAAKILKERAAMVAGDAQVKVDGASITVTAPSGDYDALMNYVLPVLGQYEIALVNPETNEAGDVVISAEHIKNAYYNATDTTVSVQLEMNKKGVKAMEELIANHAGEYLYFMQDGMPFVFITVNASTSTSVLEVQLDDWMTAYAAVACMRSGILPVAVTPGSSDIAAPTLGNLMNVVIYVAAAALLLVCLYLIVRARLSGVAAAFAVIAQVVIFCLFVATTAVTVRWRLTVPGMIVLLVCEAAFLYGLIVVLGRLCAHLHAGRGVRPAIASAFALKQHKVLGIVYGALLVVGLVLMFAFQGGLYGIMGRMVAASAVISVCAIFVYARVLLSCLVTLTGEKAPLYGPAAK